MLGLLLCSRKHASCKCSLAQPNALQVLCDSRGSVENKTSSNRGSVWKGLCHRIQGAGGQVAKEGKAAGLGEGYRYIMFLVFFVIFKVR